MRDHDLVVVGSANADLVIAVDRRPGPGETVLGSDLAIHPGGKGANQACAAARLGARTALLARVGDDAYGRLLLASQRSAGVDTGAVLVGGAPTGAALITVDPSGDNSIVVSPGANARLTREDVRNAADLLASAPVVSAQLEIPLETVTEVVRNLRPGTRFALNPSPAVPLPDEVLAACDPLIVNEHEARTLLGLVDRVSFTAGGRPAHNVPAGAGAGRPEDSSTDGSGAGRAPDAAEAWARALLARGPRSVVVTLGAAGALVADRRGTVRVPAVPVTAVDTTGAGDAFAAALAWRLAAGAELASAAGFAARVGAVTVTRRGAQKSFPVLDEVDSGAGSG